jgi:hypothetical protein
MAMHEFVKKRQDSMPKTRVKKRIRREMDGSFYKVVQEVHSGFSTF